MRTSALTGAWPSWYEKRYPEAAESLQAAVQANPDDSEAHTLLAVVFGKLGDAAAQRKRMDWLAEHEVGRRPAGRATCSPCRVSRRIMMAAPSACWS